MFGLKIAALMLVVMGVVGGVGYWYYNDTQKRLAILNENNAKLETAAAIQTEAIETMQKDLKIAQELSLIHI